MRMRSGKEIKKGLLNRQEKNTDEIGLPNPFLKVCHPGIMAKNHLKITRKTGFSMENPCFLVNEKKNRGMGNFLQPKRQAYIMCV